MNSLTGIPLRSWTFLKTSSASCGRSAGAWAARRAPPHTPPHTPPNPRVAIAMAPATVPLNLLLARGASEELVVVLLLLRRAVVLHEIGARLVQTHLELHRLPWLGIHRRIFDGLRPLELVEAHTPEPFDGLDLIADRPAGRIEPHTILGQRSDRCHFERAVVDPGADRIAEDPLFPVLTVDLNAAVQHLGELSSIGPDHPPAIVVVIRDQHLDRVLEGLRQPDVVVVVAWHAQRLA